MPAIAVINSNYTNRRQRLIQLATPKRFKSNWITNVGPIVQWGTQETLWPVSKGALNAVTTPRLEDLATPKNNFQSGERISHPEFEYSCGRASAIWEVSPLTWEAKATARLEELANPKKIPNEYKDHRPHFVFSCGRSSPILEVTNDALTAPERPRTVGLAQHKETHPEFIANRQVQTTIPPAALRAKSSGRLDTLSMPKPRLEGPFRDPEWPVTDLAKKASPTGRSMELAKPKAIVDGYAPAREVMWQVTKAAKHTTPTSRMDELAKPIVRDSMDHVQFDPNAFLVKETALKSKASRRIEELAIPLTR